VSSSKSLKALAIVFFMSGIWDMIGGINYAFMIGTIYKDPPIDRLDEYSLQVSEEDLYTYIEAAKKFWDEMPERAYSNTDTLIKEFKKQQNM
jgi:hypothetical protein